MGSKIAVNRTQSSLTQSKKTSQGKDQSLTKVQTVRNALDSTAPTIRRGKEREKPKKRRPTKMRKIIAAERAAGGPHRGCMAAARFVYAFVYLV